MRILPLIPIAMLFAAMPALAAAPKSASPAPKVSNDDQATYEACMAAARNAPEDGYQLAASWLARNGGEPAEHCQAIALIGLQRFGEAGQQLEMLANKLSPDDLEMRGEALSQAAEAWSQDGRPERAEADLDQAIKLDPADLDYRTDRAIARAAQHNYTGAIEDLTAVISANPGRGDAFAYRAAAYRLSGDLQGARADADKAVEKAPTMPEAWLERANVRGLTGDADGARRDWDKVVVLAPDSAAASAARRNLQALGPADAKAAAPPADASPPSADTLGTPGADGK